MLDNATASVLSEGMPENERGIFAKFILPSDEMVDSKFAIHKSYAIIFISLDERFLAILSISCRARAPTELYYIEDICMFSIGVQLDYITAYPRLIVTSRNDYGC